MNKRTNYTKERADYVPADDYYTPSWVFEKLKTTFDLDVCAPRGGVPWLPAKNHYHLEINGLGQPWYGRIWMNPPYSNSAPWIAKFMDHGNGIALIQTSKSNQFIHLWNHCDAIMYLPRNIMFEHKHRGTQGIFMPVALFAMGEENVEIMVQSGINAVRISKHAMPKLVTLW